MNQYLEKLAFTKGIANYVGNVSGKRAAQNAARIKNIEGFVTQYGIHVPRNVGRKLHAEQRVLEKARDRARITTGVATGIGAGSIAGAGAYSYHKAKARANAEEHKLYSQFLKSAALSPHAQEKMLGVAKQMLSAGKAGTKAVGRAAGNFVLHATGGKMLDYGSNKGLKIDSLGYAKFKSAVKAKRLDKATSLLGRYGDKASFDSMRQVNNDLKILQAKKTGARIGTAIAAGAGINYLANKEPSQPTRYYY